MIDQDLINRVELALTTEGVYLSKGDVAELHKNYVSLIEQNAELYKASQAQKSLLDESADALIGTNNVKALYVAGKIDKMLSNGQA